MMKGLLSKLWAAIKANWKPIATRVLAVILEKLRRGQVPMVLVSVLTVSVASAQMRAPATFPYDYGKQIDGVLLSAAESSRTMELTLGTSGNVSRAANFSKLRVELNYTYGGAGITALTAVPYCKRAVDGTYARYTSRALSSGTATVSPFTDSYTVAGASIVLMLEYDIRGCQQFKLVVASTGSPHAADAVTVGAVAVAGE